MFARALLRVQEGKGGEKNQPRPALPRVARNLREPQRRIWIWPDPRCKPIDGPRCFLSNRRRVRDRRGIEGERGQRRWMNGTWPAVILGNDRSICCGTREGALH